MSLRQFCQQGRKLEPFISFFLNFFLKEQKFKIHWNPVSFHFSIGKWFCLKKKKYIHEKSAQN